MAQIPLGNAGRAVPNANIALPQTGEAEAQAAFGRAIQGIGQQMGNIAVTMQRKEDDERDKADAAVALEAYAVGKDGLRQRRESLSQRVLSGELDKDKAEAEWKSQSSEYVEQWAASVPPSKDRQKVAKAHLLAFATDLNEDVRQVVREKNRGDTRAGLMAGLEDVERDALKNRELATAKAAHFIRELGPAAGFGADDQQRLMQAFKERAAFNVAAGLVDSARTNPETIDQVMARIKSPEFADLTPERIRQVEAAADHVRDAGRLSRAQSAADEIMGAGLLLDEAMARAEKSFSGEDERVVKAELASRYSYREAAERDREQKAYGAALLEVEQRGRVSPDTWGQMSDAHRAAVLNRQQAETRQRRMEARDQPVKTDFKLYLQLRQDAVEKPQQFKSTDLKQFVDRLAGPQLEQLADMQMKLSVPATAGKAQREAATLTQQMNATMKALGIRKDEQKGKFLSYVQAEVDQAMQANGGKSLDFHARQEIIDRAVLQGPDPDALLWGQKRMFELTPDQRQRFKPSAATDAPATEIDALNEALTAQGLPLTAANRLQLYTRAMQGTAQ